MNDQTSIADISMAMRSLIKGCKTGVALPREFYTSEDVYQHDIKLFWNQSWIWVGHVSQLPNSGDFFRFDYGPESLLIVRDSEGEIGAFVNVCRHRGSRVCVEASGNARVFVCPYHAWTYELNGKLRAAREMGEGFDRDAHGLLAAHIRIFQGMIFVSTAKDAPVIDPGLEALAPLTAPFGFERMKIAFQASFPVAANWKLALENYMECYHCAPAHLEYSRSHSLKDPSEKTADMTVAMQARSRAAGLPSDVLERYDDPSETEIYYRRYPLFDGYQTGSKSGKPLAPLLGDLSGFDGGTTDVQIGILNNFLVYSDYALAYRFVPRSLQETDIQVVWFVHQDAEAGRDFDLDALTWLWKVTSHDDERIIRVNQEGVNSHHFLPGPLSEMEWGIQIFYDSYLARLRQGLSQG